MGKRVTIVFEEVGERAFNVFMEGVDTKRVARMSIVEQTEQLSPAEFWGVKAYQHTMDLLKYVGVIESIDGKKSG